jgi:hypothetical protein
MKRKILRSIGMLILVLWVSGCSISTSPVSGSQSEVETSPSVFSSGQPDTTNENTSPKYIIIGSADTVSFGSGFIKHSVDELEDTSSAIVKATVLFSQLPDYDSIPNLSEYCSNPEGILVTLTTVLISEVYKNDSDLKQGSEITINETYKIRSVIDGTTIVDTLCGTHPMQKGNTYLLFLNRVPNNAPVRYGGDYYLSYEWQSKYLVSDKIINSSNIAALTYDDLEYTKKNMDQVLVELASQVYEKYVWGPTQKDSRTAP